MGPDDLGRNEHLLFPILAQISELNNLSKNYRKNKDNVQITSSYWQMAQVKY